MTENVQQDSAWNTGKYGYDSVHIRGNPDQRKPVFRHISSSEWTLNAN